jgi:hypothetical protein
MFYISCKYGQNLCLREINSFWSSGNIVYFFPVKPHIIAFRSQYTAILIKETIEHYKLLKYEENSIQATSIKVKWFPYEITVTAVYYPPRYNLKRKYFEIFFQRLRPKFIAGGDYNNKHTIWSPRLTKKGRNLSKVVQEKNYSFLSTGTPKYWLTDENKIPAPKRKHIVGRRFVKTLYVFCYIRPDFSKPHPGSAVARHMTRLTPI